jgi:hypothetical protein
VNYGSVVQNPKMGVSKQASKTTERYEETEYEVPVVREG